MIARLTGTAPATLYPDFLEALRSAGFRGQLSADYATRTVLATDNSIYQRLPQAAVFPVDADDVARIAALMAEPRFQAVKLTPRGGGTGTNGQSLTDGIVVDLSRHMNSILEINVEERWVRVQAGVVKDQLNAALKPYGLFFAPELSTSNRATVGGMINTDASGQGSCTYGKTRDHVLELHSVLLGGQRLHTRPLNEAELDQACAETGRVGEVYRTARTIQETKAELIEQIFPKLNRCLTGYDLAHLRDEQGCFNLNSVLCGAEGSLGYVVEAKLNVLPIPKYAVLVNVRYSSFMDALRDANALMAHKPLSIETVDSKVLMLAMKDIVWHSVAEYFPADAERPTLGINLVEFCGDDPQEVNARVQAFVAHLQADTGVERLGHTLAEGAEAVTRVYTMRKRSVGLLGNVEGEVRPQPFVEDTAVPPEQLADYIAEFRALLDGYGLAYGMFGHVDAGVLHVRPALDMKDPAQAALVKPISDAVAALTLRYGGLLWGEHGKGLRSEYVPEYFGELYPSLQALKGAFDPHNQLNPGKICTPPDSAQGLIKVNEAPLRGDFDRQIDERVWQSFGSAVHCNGNGACYNYDPNDAMCPSWKATRERQHSPKGRASLIREWLRLQGAANIDVLATAQGKLDWVKGLPARLRNNFSRSKGEADFSHEVYDAMAGCLACKSCAGQCPIKVNVPEFRSRFLELYHGRYQRPLRDYLIGSLEFSIPYLAHAPGLYNAVMGSKWVSKLLEQQVGMLDSPLISRYNLQATLTRCNVRMASIPTLRELTPAQRERSIVLVQDAFTRYFETPVLAAFIDLAYRLGQRIYLAPYSANGKPLHVQGFLGAFNKAAIRNARQLSALADCGVPLVGLDPAMTLVYRQEYLKVPGLGECPKVLLPQEWLMEVLPEQPGRTTGTFRLMAHCTEKTNVPASTRQWEQVFARVGLKLSTEATGCCGMSGTYGHEARNQQTSKTIFEQSWASKLDKEGEALATGYSCRSQVKRQADRTLRHPLQVLLQQLNA
ncbi:D-2-hydroxyglutarate dehydrogenase YdiJ [Pseudomonas auratipiscis]|uniref:D-2-hydroxyglutarate dehydrogenase n=1 Tax=Pseudomonas auratipiscis TaxID=3115853 RepID=A0AB35WQQ8_9PSED|nr:MULTISPECIES: FAD-binding and (Fe-S)-binding domain-containing protein [unclassified Pseudomonas]MEE1866767.1 FAD-binding and (Fe-S)-binding domain-containing protein [Pseudomonas sp. 120P]MEE1958663.1 FAD-binding and (Fe-S)-binding domain-containing protein [Pseudomonas sp. 119P]